jgi:hypothetical protein
MRPSRRKALSDAGWVGRYHIQRLAIYISPRMVAMAPEEVAWVWKWRGMEEGMTSRRAATSGATWHDGRTEELRNL